MRDIKRSLRIAEWEKLLEERVRSGKTINAWCKEQGIPRSMYFYWQRRVRESAVKNATIIDSEIIVPIAKTETMAVTGVAFSDTSKAFVKIPNPNYSNLSGAVPAMSVRIGMADCEIYNGADPDVIEHTLLALGKIC